MSTPFYASSESVEWYTPRYIVDAVERVLGAIDCDPCSNPPPYNVPAVVHYTQVEDGLLQTWAGRVFMNPPFGRGIDAWISKLLTERALGHTTAAIALLPGSTDTEWFQPVWTADALCFVKGRVAFIGASDNGNTKPSVLAYWGPDPASFAAVFGAFGQIIPRLVATSAAARQMALPLAVAS